jgi:Zn-dependent protease
MRAFRIGRLFGVDIRIDSSWIFIAVLLTWNLIAVFSRWHPDWSPSESVVVAGAASLLFFGCILLHELAHSLAAMAYGVNVRSITLFLFGGVSDIEREPPSARIEFVIAIVGPITSLVLGFGILALASLMMSVSVSSPEAAWTGMAELGPAMTLLAWLGPINIVIGLFNLVPGFPLDGGRVLRSILWSITGNLHTATRWASATGQLVGWLLIASGIAMSFGAHVPFFGTGLVAGLWLAFIGWFLHSAAAQAVARLALDDALSGITVAQLMQPRSSVATPGLPVATLVHDLIVPGDDRAVPVVEDGSLVGLVSVSDVRALPPEKWAETSVGSIMRPVGALALATPGEPLAKAFERIARQNIDQLPVVMDGRLVGMLRRRDVTRWLELAWRPIGGSAGRAVPSDERGHTHSGSRPQHAR